MTFHGWLSSRTEGGRSHDERIGAPAMFMRLCRLDCGLCTAILWLSLRCDG
jgi:hypothetical protein